MRLLFLLIVGLLCAAYPETYSQASLYSVSCAKGTAEMGRDDPKRQPEKPDRRNEAERLRSMLQTIRSQVALYANQHIDKAPHLIRRGWLQLTGQTDIYGLMLDEADDQVEYGPYLIREPENPVVGSSRVCGLGWIDPEAGWAYDQETGMIYAVVSDEDAVKLGLDAIDVRTFDADVPRMIDAIQADLAVARNAIDLFATEHGGEYPSLDHFAEQLTTYTDVAGNPNPKKNGRFIYGPYIRRVPRNALNGSDRVCSPDALQDGAGWAYDESAGKLRAIIDLDTPEGRDLALLLSREDIVCVHGGESDGGDRE